MTDEQNIINEAFENHLRSSLDKEARERIAARYGEEIAARAEFIYRDALDHPVDWRTSSMDAALESLARFLDGKYSWLSAQARSNINYAFIMCWK